MTTRSGNNNNESEQYLLYYCYNCEKYAISRCNECNSENGNNLFAATRQTSPQQSPNKSIATPTNQNLLDKSIGICSICLEAIGDHSKTLICSHCFHSDCIDPWLETKTTCPVCRKIVSTSRQSVGSVASGITRQYDINQSMVTPLPEPESRASRSRFVFMPQRVPLPRNRRRDSTANNGQLSRTRSQSRPQWRP